MSADVKYALMWSAVSVVVASFVVFVVSPGGLEDKFANFSGLMPGFLVASWLSQFVNGNRPHPVLDLTLFPIIIGASYIWYFLLSFTAVKLFRFVRRRRSST
ncbi:MAG TPA: hypothetical protein VGD60_00085 [Candidatus Acidoferrales bacterium]